MSANIEVGPDNTLTFLDSNFRCALGRNGISASKQEGDGTTPAGLFPLREVLYRADRIPCPNTCLLTTPIRIEDGWCDDTVAQHYNQKIAIPSNMHHEVLWRADHLYDLIVAIGYNDDPVVPGKGSAIFLHCSHPHFVPTDGCIALALDDLCTLIKHVTKETHVHIRAWDGGTAYGAPV